MSPCRVRPPAASGRGAAQGGQYPQAPCRPPGAVGRPSIPVVEADGRLIAVEDPQRGGGVAEVAQAVDGGIVQLCADSPPLLVGPQIDRVQLAPIRCSRGTSVGSDGGEADDGRATCGQQNRCPAW